MNTDNERSYDPDDPFAPEVIDEPVPSEEEATGESKSLPPGDYLVKVVELEHDTYHGENDSWDNAEFKLEVVEPKQFKGRVIFDRVRLYKKGEPDWVRRRRYGVIIESGHAEEGDGEALANHYWPDMLGQLYTYRLGQVKIYSETEGKVMIRNQPANFIGFKPEEFWQSDDCEKAPQEPEEGTIWEIKDRTGDKGKKGGKKKTGKTGSKSSEKKDLPEDL